MDLNIIVGWSVALLTVSGAVVFFIRRSKNGMKRDLEPLLTFASENNAAISEYDMWDKSLIGIDNSAIKTLFFIRNVPGENIRQQIKLSEVSDCRMYKSEQKVHSKKETVNVIHKIEVHLSYYNHKPGITLEFYNDEYDQLTLSGELQLAQKWTAKIKDIVDVYPAGNRKVKRQELISQNKARPVQREKELSF